MVVQISVVFGLAGSALLLLFKSDRTALRTDMYDIARSTLFDFGPCSAYFGRGNQMDL